MARGSQTSFFLGLSFVAYFVLLLSPLGFLQTANAAESAQEPLQENYGTGKLLHVSAAGIYSF
jgi:hypothetical protein